VRSISRAMTAAGLIAFALAIAAGGFLGARVAASASEPDQQVLVLADPALFDGPPANARRSPGGFTGFGGALLPGEVITGGQLFAVEVTDEGGSLVLLDGSSETSLRLSSALRLFAIAPDATLAAGDPVVLRIVDGEVVAVLRVVADTQPEDEPAE